MVSRRRAEVPDDRLAAAGSRANRISLSMAHVPMWVDVMYRMFEKSKVSSAPSSERSSSSLSRCSRSTRNLSRSTRCSQSTALGPNVRIAIPVHSPLCSRDAGATAATITVSVVRPDPTRPRSSR